MKNCSDVSLGGTKRMVEQPPVMEKEEVELEQMERHLSIGCNVCYCEVDQCYVLTEGKEQMRESRRNLILLGVIRKHSQDKLVAMTLHWWYILSNSFRKSCCLCNDIQEGRIHPASYTFFSLTFLFYPLSCHYRSLIQLTFPILLTVLWPVHKIF